MTFIIKYGPKDSEQYESNTWTAQMEETEDGKKPILTLPEALLKVELSEDSLAMLAWLEHDYGLPLLPEYIFAIVVEYYNGGVVQVLRRNE